MRSLGFLLFPWGLILQVLAIIHFIRRRPETYWLFIIVFLGPLGAFIYILMEVVPDLGLLAHAYANTGEADKADARFQRATELSTNSETYFNYATFLASRNRNAEAREWAERILAKKPTMPGYLRRRERPWFRSASGL